MKLFDSFVNSAESIGYLDSVTKDGDTYTLVANNKMLNIKEHFDDKGMEVLLWSDAEPTKLFKVVGSDVEKVLPRLVVQHFTGLKNATITSGVGDNRVRYNYQDVGFYPSMILSGQVVFEDGIGRKWLCSASNVPNVTLAFYKLLYDGRTEMSAMMMPRLERRDDVKINLVKSGASTVSSVGGEVICSSVADFERSIPNLRDYMLFPHEKDVPDYGVAVVSGMTVTSADREFIGSAGKKLSGFIGSAGNVTLTFSSDGLTRVGRDGVSKWHIIQDELKPLCNHIGRSVSDDSLFEVSCSTADYDAVSAILRDGGALGVKVIDSSGSVQSSKKLSGFIGSGRGGARDYFPGGYSSEYEREAMGIRMRYNEGRFSAGYAQTRLKDMGISDEDAYNFLNGGELPVQGDSEGIGSSRSVRSGKDRYIRSVKKFVKSNLEDANGVVWSPQNMAELIMDTDADILADDPSMGLLCDLDWEDGLDCFDSVTNGNAPSEEEFRPLWDQAVKIARQMEQAKAVQPGDYAQMGGMYSSRSIRSAIDAAELLNIKLHDTGSFDVNIGRNVKGTEIYSGFHGSLDAGLLIAAAKKDGYSYADLQAGVDFTGSPVLPEIKGLIKSAVDLKAQKQVPIKRSVESWVISGKDLDKELDRWGLKNPAGVFQSVSVLGVSLDGSVEFPKPEPKVVVQSSGKSRVNSGSRRSVASAPSDVSWQARVGNDTFGAGDGSVVNEGSNLHDALKYISGIYPSGGVDFDTVGSTLWESGQFGDDEDQVMDLAYQVCEQMGIPIASSGKSGAHLGFKKPLASVGKGQVASGLSGSDPDEEARQWAAGYIKDRPESNFADFMTNMEAYDWARHLTVDPKDLYLGAFGKSSKFGAERNPATGTFHELGSGVRLVGSSRVAWDEETGEECPVSDGICVTDGDLNWEILEQKYVNGEFDYDGLIDYLVSMGEDPDQARLAADGLERVYNPDAQEQRWSNGPYYAGDMADAEGNVVSSRSVASARYYHDPDYMPSEEEAINKNRDRFFELMDSENLPEFDKFSDSLSPYARDVLHHEWQDRRDASSSFKDEVDPADLTPIDSGDSGEDLGF